MENFEQHQGGERAILVSVAVQLLDDLDAEEFRLLAQSAGAEILEHISVQRNKPDPKFFIGSGKVDEIAEQVKDLEAELVIFDHSLSPAQERNLEKVLKCRVIDRTGLILDIFALRARTHEGKLQVELAQLKHLSTRLIRGFTGNLEQQKGGIGLRGPGESQLETDRRLIRVRITQLKEKLVKVQQTRLQGRAARQKAAIPTISLVGYTNAGKSTLFNILAKSDYFFRESDSRLVDGIFVMPRLLVDQVTAFVRHAETTLQVLELGVEDVQRVTATHHRPIEALCGHPQ